MRKILVMLCVLVLLLSGNAYGVGSVTETWSTGADVTVLTLSWTADASAATVPTTTTTSHLRGHIFMIATVPGSPAPTDNYDITLTDADGVDVTGGEGANRDTTAPEQITPKMGGLYGPRYVPTTLTLTLSGNSVNSATGSVKVYIRRQR